MNFLLYATFLHLYFQQIPAFLNYQELKMSLDLVKELGIRQCILVENSKNEDLTYYTKEFSKTKIPVSYFDDASLVEYILNTKIDQLNTGIIVKDKNLYFLQQRIFEKVGKISFGVRFFKPQNTLKYFPFRKKGISFIDGKILYG